VCVHRVLSLKVYCRSVCDQPNSSLGQLSDALDLSLYSATISDLRRYSDYESEVIAVAARVDDWESTCVYLYIFVPTANMDEEYDVSDQVQLVHTGLCDQDQSS
jgi:hypothetical protein